MILRCSGPLARQIFGGSMAWPAPAASPPAPASSVFSISASPCVALPLACWVSSKAASGKKSSRQEATSPHVYRPLSPVKWSVTLATSKGGGDVERVAASGRECSRRHAVAWATAVTTRDGLVRPSWLAIQRLVSTMAVRSMPVSMPRPWSCHSRSSVARLPVALLA